MPGHKRSTDFIRDDLLTLDITEIDGSDNMHRPDGVILEAEKLMAQLNGCDKSLFLINGGSGGVLTAILGTLKERDKIIVCRNAHKSVYNGLVLSGAVPVYIYTQSLSGSITGGISEDTLERALRAHPDAKAVLITSPTYEGFTSPIKSLADITHKHNAILIVDETHGAHFAFSPRFPKTAMEQGADISINSWHKTLPCPNQSGVININAERVDFQRIMEAYSMVQSTSPSYIMMALMDKTRAMLTENIAMFDKFTANLMEIREMLSHLRGMKLAGRYTFNNDSIDDYDISKLVIMTGENLNGKALAQILLKEYNIQIELADRGHIIAMTSVADTRCALMKFAEALLETDRSLKPYKQIPAVSLQSEAVMPVISPRCAFYGKTVSVNLDNAEGLIAGECITPFPPDIPLIITGERITGEHIKKIKAYQNNGIIVMGGENNKIKVLEEK